MTKERFLTVMVPISDSDCEATVYQSIAALQSVVPASASNKDKIYRIADGTYCRSVMGVGSMYSYVTVTEREFPRLGNPLEIYDFTYDSTRMGTAPTISAQGVMRYADKDAGGNDITLDELWSSECFVVFNGERMHLRRTPNSSKSNEDARYKYDMEFVSDRVVLENTYFYDVVSPFITEKPISESSTFSFFGDINELAKRLNASMIRSGLAKLTRKYVGYPSHPSQMVPYLKYEQWNMMAVNPYSLLGVVFDTVGEMTAFNSEIYSALGGDYNMYLMEYVYENDGTDFETSCYKVVIGTDKKGEVSSSEEKMLTFDKNTLHEALQTFHDTFGLDYYVTFEQGDTVIMVADCEHDFADVDPLTGDLVRGDDGIPISTHPFDYGAVSELLSKEKNAKNDKLVTRITGVGSSENLPWHYPNPTPDGWIRPVYKIGGIEDPSVTVDYPKTDADLDYEKYLRNRIGNAFRYGVELNFWTATDYSELKEVSVIGSDAKMFYVEYRIVWKDSTDNRVTLSFPFPSDGGCQYFTANLYDGAHTMTDTYDSRQTYASPTEFQKMCVEHNGKDYIHIQKSCFLRLYFFIGQMPNSVRYDYEGYHYPSASEQNPSNPYIYGFVGENFYDYRNLSPFVAWSSLVPVDSGYSTDGTVSGKVLPKPRILGKKYLDASNGTIYKCTDQDATVITSGEHKDGFEANPAMGFGEWIAAYLSSFMIRLYDSFGWYLGNESVDLSDYGLGAPQQGGSAYAPQLFDTIDFQRLAWLTPQPNLMPEVYIRTDGERRFYDAHNYYPLKQGTPDTAIGEENNDGTTDIVNPIYKENETDADDKHYAFENEFSERSRVEHIEDFEGIKPTIKEQTIIVGGVELRIDVVEEFGYDVTDNDEVWESNGNDGAKTGEYKHPYFFAKLRPLGFNIFDLALQDDMVVSMTTGQCGACNFRIGVDENTRKNPVQLWEYDVYSGTWSERVKVYDAFSLRRYVDLSGLYYDTDGTEGGYVSVATYMTSHGIGGGVANNQQEWADIMFDNYTYPISQVENGEVGVTKQGGKKWHFEGDVVTQGRFMDRQQDTTSEYVWVALMKDTETYGVVMPAARPYYDEHQFDIYIRPKSVADVHTEQSTAEEDEEKADKFVLTNIAMPQAYLRRAERKLSRELVKYMYEHNAQKYNLPLRFSRIFLDENPTVDGFVNENSVVYVLFDRRVYRQYVRHYTYTMSHDEALPEITVDTNEELPVTMTMLQRQEKSTKRASMAVSRNFNVVNQKIREVSKSSNTYVSGGGSTVIENKLEWGEF